MAQGSTARRPHSNQIAYLDPKTIAYTAANGNYSLGKLPRGSRIFGLLSSCTGFSASGTRALTVGTNSTTYNNIANGTDITEETAQNSMIVRGAALTFTQDTEVFARFTSSGTAATTGRATLILAYVPPAYLE